MILRPAARFASRSTIHRRGPKPRGLKTEWGITSGFVVRGQNPGGLGRGLGEEWGIDGVVDGRWMEWGESGVDGEVEER